MSSSAAKPFELIDLTDEVPQSHADTTGRTAHDSIDLMSDDDDDAEFTALLRKRVSLDPMTSSKTRTPLALRDTNTITPRDTTTPLLGMTKSLAAQADANVTTPLATRTTTVESTAELGRVDFVIQPSSSETLVKDGEELRLERKDFSSVSAQVRLFCCLCC
jgi:hypothetical protein